jgi:3-oxoacyl-(acyl-carrier-protein) synthase
LSTREFPRVVVTGMAINTPLADRLQPFLDALLAGRSAVTHWKAFDTTKIYSKIGGDLSGYDVKARVGELKETIPEAVWRKLRKLVAKAPMSTRLSMLLAVDAFVDAGLFEAAPESHRCATVVAGHNINENYVFGNRNRYDEEPDWIDATMSVSRLDTDHGACVSETLGLRGPLYTVGGACASGNVALRLAADELRYRDNDVAVVMGAVLDYNPMELHAMALVGAISFRSFNDAPERASRPFDKRREGFVPSHGGGCMVLETLEHARRRGARIYAEVLAVEASSDANHTPTPSEDGQVALIERVLERANIAPQQIDYVNAHATSTPLGDIAEVRALKRVFGDHAYRLKVNATKSMLGHTCWSSATVESIGSILQMNAGRLHPSINIDEIEPEIDLDVCNGQAQDHEIRCLLKNSFGFGGINSVAVFGSAP